MPRKLWLELALQFQNSELGWLSPTWCHAIFAVIAILRRNMISRIVWGILSQGTIGQRNVRNSSHGYVQKDLTIDCFLVVRTSFALFLNLAE